MVAGSLRGGYGQWRPSWVAINRPLGHNNPVEKSRRRFREHLQNHRSHSINHHCAGKRPHVSFVVHAVTVTDTHPGRDRLVIRMASEVDNTTHSGDVIVKTGDDVAVKRSEAVGTKFCEGRVEMIVDEMCWEPVNSNYQKGGRVVQWGLSGRDHPWAMNEGVGRKRYRMARMRVVDSIISSALSVTEVCGARRPSPNSDVDATRTPWIQRCG